MYCSNCGKEVKETDVYCASCGTKIGSTERRVENAPETRKVVLQFTGQEMKWWVYKAIYIILIVFVWQQSQKGMFEVEMFQFGDTRYALAIDGLMDNVFSIKQYAGESVLVAKLCYWCYEIAIFGYVAAVILALLQKEETAKSFSELGFLLHLPILLYTSLRGVSVVLQSWSFEPMIRFKEVFDALNEEFWIYVVLNVIILICSVYFFSNVNFVRQYSSKSYSALEHVAPETKTMKAGDWRCEECGKINAYYLYVCSCGCRKDK